MPKIIYTINHKKSLYTIIYGAFGIALFNIIFATCIQDTYAANMDFSINVKPSASITVPSTPINLSIDPSRSNGFSSAVLNIEAGTSYDSGYTIIMQSGHTPGEIDNYNLVNTSSNDTNDPSANIPILTSTYTESTFPANHWGIKVGNSTDYTGIGTNGAIASTTDKGGNTVPVTLAAKTDYLQAPGTYETTLNFSIIANIDSSMTIDNYTYMQDIATLSTTNRQALVDSMIESKTYTLKDSRDNQDYTIAKLKDGKVWMTKNLNLAGGTKLDSEGSNVPAGYTQANPYYTLPASETISSGTSLNNRTDETKPFSSDTVDYVFNSSNNTTDCTSSKPCNSYYSWLAATAGGKDASGSAVTGNGYDTAYSICPKGWRLPTSGNSSDSSATSTTGYKKGDFYKLAIQYGMSSNNYFQNTSSFYNQAGPGTTPNFLLAGYYTSGSFNDGGSYGYYWSATSYSSAGGYSLDFGSSNVSSASSSNRRYGFPVRCVLDTTGPTIDDLAYMQDFAKLDITDRRSVVNSMEANKNYTLKDTRDNQDYTIARLTGTTGNGYSQVWMTKNLNIAGGTALYSDDSNVPATGYTKASGNAYYTLPASETISSGTSLNNRTDETKPFSSDTVDYVFNSSNNTTDCTSSKPCNSYYSWLAATAGGKDASGSAVTSDGYNTAYSICPKGWRLPTATTEGVSRDNGGYTGGDFYRMILGYMNGATSLNQGYYDNTKPNPFYTNAGPGTTPNFLLAGRYESDSFNYGGSSGTYWSATSRSGITGGYGLYFNSGYVDSAYNSIRRTGSSVRCVLAE